MRGVPFVFLSLGVLSVFLATRGTPQSPPAAVQQGKSKPAAIGLEKRAPWTTSRITGSPEAPPPFKTERLFPKLAFKEPVTMARAPGSKRLFMAELRGMIYSFPNDQGVEKPDLLLDVSKLPGHWRTYGLVFHPRFAENGFLYVCYVTKPGNPKGSRVSRFKLAEKEPPRADPASETVIIDWPSGGHNGGCLQFGPDGYLYITTGDGTDPSPPDRLLTGQDVTDLLASILRIDVDRPAADKPYSIPPDNPFVSGPAVSKGANGKSSIPANARPEIWAYGLRNPWKIAFDPKNDALWVGDVGWEMWEMVYRVERGGNYGWSVVEGKQPVRAEAPRGPTPILPPTVAHAHTEARSITGGRVYHGPRFKELEGAYIYGDYVTGKLWGVKHDGTNVTWFKHLADSPLEIIDFADDDHGELFIVDHGGSINRLVPDAAAQPNRQFPKKLSETGLFANVKNHEPAPGVLPYSINAEPWADHARAERLFAVPGLTTLGLYDKQNLQQGIVKGAWIYPTDTVFAKTLSLEMERGNPATRRRLETQVLHQDRGTWRAYNYIWNEEQTDAILAGSDGSEKVFTIKASGSGTGGESAGGVVKQTWHFASRTECLICHTTRAGSILGFNAAQLNRVHEYGGLAAPQLDTLKHLGLFEKPLPDPLPRLPHPHAAHETLHDRARAYLHANCAHCHRRGGGGTAPFELLYEFDLKKLLLVGSRPTQGTFDIPGAENVAAGDPYRSVLYYRMAKLGPGHMPHAGSSVIDTRGLMLVHDWIASLPPAQSKDAPRPPVITQEHEAALALLKANANSKTEDAIRTLLASPSSALFVLHAIDAGQLSGAMKKKVVTAALEKPALVRDLFERFLPEEQRTKRLGAVVKPAEILALPGDAARGREIFFKSAGAQCRNCHRIGKEGVEIGPDLTQVGKKYDRGLILENILEPSKKIEPQYVTYLLETTRGAIHSGLLIKKTEAEVVLKDAQGKLITVPARDVEVLAPQPKSLMPELLLREMTARDVADLLEFLSSLK